MANKISVLIDVAVDGANRSIKSFRQSIADADGATGKFKAGASSAFDTLKANAGNLAIAGGAALVTFGAKAVSSFTDAALAAGQFADATGLSNEEASKWISVADDYGLSAETLEKSFLRLNKSIGDGSKYVKEYGIEQQLAADGTVDVNATMMEAIKIIGGIEDPTKRAAAAQDVFGRSYADVAEIILGDSDKVLAALESTSDAQIFDDDEVRRAREYRAAMDNLGDVMTDLTMTIGGGLAPAFAEAADNAASMVRVLQDLGLVDLAAKFQDATSASGNLERVWGTATGQSDLFGRSVRKLTDEQWAQLQAAIAAGASEAELKEITDSFKESTEEATEATEDNTSATESAAAADKAAAEAAQDRTTELDRMRKSIDDARRAEEAKTNATLAAIDSNLGYRNAQASATEAVIKASQATDDAGTVTDEYADAQRDAEGAVLNQAAAAVKLAEDQAEANGVTLTAQEKANIYRNELVQLSGYLDGPLRAAIDGYIATLGRIPGSIYTNISTTRSGDFTPTVTGRRASGGPVSPGGTYLVGEEGPELLQMGSGGGTVIPNHDLPTGGGTGGGPTTVNVHVNGGDPNTIIAAIRKYVRTNGPITGIT